MCMGTCTSCASAKIPPVYEGETCSVTITPGKIKIQLKQRQYRKSVPDLTVKN